MGEAAREKLRRLRHRAAGGRADRRVRDLPARRPAETVACPHCGSTPTVLVTQFGSTACKALYRCHDCREPFDYFKRH